MRRELKIAAFLLSLLLPMQATAGPIASHLIPLQPDFGDADALQPYLLTLRARLLGPRRAFGLSVLVTPSFKAEWAIQVAWDQGEPIVLFARADESLWYTLQKRAEASGRPEAELLPTLEVPVSRFAATMFQATGDDVTEAWSAMFRTARQPKEQRLGIDGVGFFFDLYDASGERAAYAWSPRVGSATAALVELVEALRAHAVAPEASRGATDNAIIEASRVVLDRAAALR